MVLAWFDVDKELNRRTQLFQEMEKQNKIISEELKKRTLQCSELTDKNDALEASLRDYFKVTHAEACLYISRYSLFNSHCMYDIFCMDKM